MTHLLDTDTCIAHLRGRPSSVTARLAGTSPTDLALCSVVRAELLLGALKSRDPSKGLAIVEEFAAPFSSLAFDDTAASHYARLRADLERSGQIIGPNDMMIAAIALASDLTLVTHNTQEFRRVGGLRLEDWMA